MCLYSSQIGNQNNEEKQQQWQQQQQKKQLMQLCKSSSLSCFFELDINLVLSKDLFLVEKIIRGSHHCKTLPCWKCHFNVCKIYLMASLIGVCLVVTPSTPLDWQLINKSFLKTYQCTLVLQKRMLFEERGWLYIAIILL